MLEIMQVIHPSLHSAGDTRPWVYATATCQNRAKFLLSNDHIHLQSAGDPFSTSSTAKLLSSQSAATMIIQACFSLYSVSSYIQKIMYQMVVR